MDEEKSRFQKMQCLQLAVDAGKHTNTSAEILGDATKFWAWMEGTYEAEKAPSANN